MSSYTSKNATLTMDGKIIGTGEVTFEVTQTGENSFDYVSKGLALMVKNLVDQFNKFSAEFTFKDGIGSTIIVSKELERFFSSPRVYKRRLMAQRRRERGGSWKELCSMPQGVWHSRRSSSERWQDYKRLFIAEDSHNVVAELKAKCKDCSPCQEDQ